jgi:chromosome segregation ATPase
MLSFFHSIEQALNRLEQNYVSAKTECLQISEQLNRLKTLNNELSAVHESNQRELIELRTLRTQLETNVAQLEGQLTLSRTEKRDVVLLLESRSSEINRLRREFDLFFFLFSLSTLHFLTFELM